MGTHIVSLYYRTAWWVFMKLCRGEVLMARTCVQAIYQIRPGVDPRHGKKESKRASKTKGLTWNAAILVVVSAKYSNWWIQGRATIGRGSASPLTKSSVRPNVHSNILMYCRQHMHLFESCHSGCLFSAPEPKAQVHYCDHALSVVRPSVVLPSLTFHIFDFSSETIEQNLRKLDRKQELNILYQVCVFRADRKNKMAALASDWLRHFRLLLWNRRTEFNETWQEARSQRPLPSLSFSGRPEKQDGRPGLWLAETFSTSPLKRLNGIQQNLTGSKIWMSSTKFVFFRLIGKTRWPPWALIGWDIFDFSSETAEQNSTKLDRKQDLNVLYQVCVFQADRKNKMAALASDWLRHFRLLLWNRWTEFNETWQEAGSKSPLLSLCFSGQ